MDTGNRELKTDTRNYNQEEKYVKSFTGYIKVGMNPFYVQWNYNHIIEEEHEKCQLFNWMLLK